MFSDATQRMTENPAGVFKAGKKLQTPSSNIQRNSKPQHPRCVVAESGSPDIELGLSVLGLEI
jgi:hypothetical protein